jgi:hypothetical protein
VKIRDVMQLPGALHRLGLLEILGI